MLLGEGCFCALGMCVEIEICNSQRSPRRFFYTKGVGVFLCSYG